MQMGYIKNLIWKNKARIAASHNQNMETTYVLYEHIEQYITKIVDKKWLAKHKIMILGGIQINVEPDDYFEPLFCKLMEEDKTTDYLEEVYAYDTIPSTPNTIA
jgi:hypothetical protein